MIDTWTVELPPFARLWPDTRVAIPILIRELAGTRMEIQGLNVPPAPKRSSHKLAVEEDNAQPEKSETKTKAPPKAASKNAVKVGKARMPNKKRGRGRAPRSPTPADTPEPTSPDTDESESIVPVSTRRNNRVRSKGKSETANNTGSGPSFDINSDSDPDYAKPLAKRRKSTHWKGKGAEKVDNTNSAYDSTGVVDTAYANDNANIGQSEHDTLDTANTIEAKPNATSTNTVVANWEALEDIHTKWESIMMSLLNEFGSRFNDTAQKELAIHYHRISEDVLALRDNTAGLTELDSWYQTIRKQLQDIEELSQHEDNLPDEVSTDHLNKKADSAGESYGVAYTAANGLADLSQYEPDFSQYSMDFKSEPVPTSANSYQTINPQYAAYDYQSQYPVAASASNFAANPGTMPVYGAVDGFHINQNTVSYFSNATISAIANYTQVGNVYGGVSASYPSVYQPHASLNDINFSDLSYDGPADGPFTAWGTDVSFADPSDTSKYYSWRS